MRKSVIFLLLFALLCPGAAAAEPTKYIALTFDGFPGGETGRVLLDALAVRDARATFFLSAETLEGSPGLGESLIAGGHEIGQPAPARQNLSRREIAREISAFRGLVPGNGRVRFLRLPGTRCADGLRQVAEVMDVSFLDWSLDPGAPAPAGRTLLDRARSGDVLRLTVTGSGDLSALLNLLDLLKDRGFSLVTASELAARRQISLRPGRRYRDFAGADL